jgi:hypothetical protein
MITPYRLSGKDLCRYFTHPDPLEVWLEFHQRPGHDHQPLTSLPKPEILNRSAAQLGKDHEAQIRERLRREHGKKFIAIDAQAEDDDKSLQTRRTLEAMQKGYTIIAGGYLKATNHLKAVCDQIRREFRLPDTPLLWGEPDLLRRVDRPGCGGLCGHWYYQPADIKAARTSKFSARIQVAFYGWLLADVQGIDPGDGYILPRPVPLRDNIVWDRVPLAVYQPIVEVFARYEYWSIVLQPDPSRLISTSGYTTQHTAAWAEQRQFFQGPCKDHNLAILPSARLPIRRQFQRRDIVRVGEFTDLTDESRSPP